MKQYLELIDQVLTFGEERGDRTGTGTISLFGTQTRYPLADGFPLLTTKEVNFRAVVAELLWMLKGSTNIKDLDSKIWDEWADENGELGPIYGHQWRKWGASRGRGGILIPRPGIDQIQQAIDTINNSPTSRRIIVSAWNVEDVPEMALPPCHLLFQFYVRSGRLDCQFYQRSADLALGVPFNIASYALLTHLIANECGLRPGVLVHTIGDAHVYLNHVDGLKEQLTRATKELPHLIISADRSFDEFTADYIVLHGYDPHPAIKFEVSV